jgi:hypothetical protein
MSITRKQIAVVAAFYDSHLQFSVVSNPISVLLGRKGSREKDTRVNRKVLKCS